LRGHREDGELSEKAAHVDARLAAHPRGCHSAPRLADGKTPDLSGIWDADKRACNEATAALRCTDVPQEVPVDAGNIVCLGLFLISGSLQAHHSFAAQFDPTRHFSITGAVTRVERTNPHIYFHVDVKDAAGAVDANSAPTAPWKTTERFSTSAHRLHPFSFKGDISIELTQGTFLTSFDKGAVVD
jgi:hypothetical protein